MNLHLNIGAIIFPGIDQLDFTGPFEVLSRLPDSTVHVLWKEEKPVRDVNGLILTPENTFAECPGLDVLVVPGGPGQEALMEDDEVLLFVRDRLAKGTLIFSVCTGALVCGAAGILRGVRATTHWASFHLLAYFGAIPIDARVVVDGKIVTAAGVTSGIDAALQVAAIYRGQPIAERIQLSMQYAPEPPFHSGSPSVAPREVLRMAQDQVRDLTSARLATAQRVAARLGIVNR